MEKLISISLAEYNFLKLRSFKLNCLESFGIETWEHYEESLDIYNSVEEVLEEYEKL